MRAGLPALNITQQGSWSQQLATQLSTPNNPGLFHARVNFPHRVSEETQVCQRASSLFHTRKSASQGKRVQSHTRSALLSCKFSRELCQQEQDPSCPQTLARTAMALTGTRGGHRELSWTPTKFCRCGQRGTATARLAQFAPHLCEKSLGQGEAASFSSSPCRPISAALPQCRSRCLWRWRPSPCHQPTALSFHRPSSRHQVLDGKTLTHSRISFQPSSITPSRPPFGAACPVAGEGRHRPQPLSRDHQDSAV